MQKRVMFVCGSVWEAELFIHRYSSITHVPWEDQKTFLYSQPRLFDDVQCIFVVTGYEASFAKKALEDALDQFQYVDHIVGHGFASGLVKHCEAGDPVVVKEIVFASSPVALTPTKEVSSRMDPTPVWTRMLALKKTFQSEVEKAAIYASSNMEVMDPICGVWFKVLSAQKVEFTFIKALMDGGNELGVNFLPLLNNRGQLEKLKVFKKSIKTPLEWLEFSALQKYRAKELTEKSHHMIRDLCKNIAATQALDLDEVVPVMKLENFSA